MKTFSLAIILVFVCSASDVLGQTLKVIDLNMLQSIISTKGEKLKVINFWATWCGPCVKELPLFEKLNSGNDKVVVYLVSMDLDLNPDLGKVTSFVEKRNIRSTVLVMNEKDPNSWISKVDPLWSGALPATLIINDATGKRKFVEKELHEGDLDKLILEIK